MATWNKVFDALQLLRDAVDRSTRNYIRTTPLVQYTVEGTRLVMDIRDVVLLGAVTESDVLLTGKTGSGKTRLAAGILEGLFGRNGYYAKTTLPNMNPSEFMDIDFPSILSGKKSLKEALSGIPALTLPGILLNEVNRAPGVIQSMLIPFLDRELEVQGTPVQMGRTWKRGQYQFRILTINEGGQYQVQNLDPAIRDRITIEIPVDAFPQSRYDVITMLEQATKPMKPSSPEAKILPQEDGLKEDLFREVLQVKEAVDEAPVPPDARFFLSYLAGMSYCIRAPRGNKESISLSLEVCEGCHHLPAFYTLCPSIYAPSARILIRLQRIAQGFALFRAWQSRSEAVTVSIEDIIQAAPFLLYSKLNLSPLWLRTAGDRTRPFLGDRWTAIKEILSWVRQERFLPLTDRTTEIGEFLFMVSKGKDISRKQWEMVYNYLQEKDPWAFDPAMVRAFLSK